MSTSKIMALIGNVLMTLSSLLALGVAAIVLAVINDPYRYGNIFDDHYYYNYDSDRILAFVTAIVIIILVLVIVMNVFTWIAFAKMEGPHGRGWKIFLLVMGVLNIGTFFAGVFFILAFALNSSKNQPVDDTLSY